MGYDKLATEEEADLLQGSLIKRGPNKNLIALGAIGAIVLIAVIVVVAVTAGGSSSADTSVDANEITEEKAAATSTLKITGDFTDEGAQIAAQEAIAAELEVDVAVLESDYSYNIECDDSGITCTITITFVQEDSSPSIDIDEEAIEDAVEVVEGVSGVDADVDFESVDVEGVDVEGVDVDGVSDVDANVVDDVVDDGDDGDDDDDSDDSTKTIPSTSTDEVDITFSLDFDFDFAGEETEGMEGMSEMMNEFVACADDFYAMLYPLYTQEEVTCEQQTALVDAYMTLSACTGEDGQESLDQFCAGEINDDESPDFLEVSCLC